MGWGGVGVGDWGFQSFNNEGGWGGSFKMFDLPRCPMKGFYPFFYFENLFDFFPFPIFEFLDATLKHTNKDKLENSFSFLVYWGSPSLRVRIPICAVATCSRLRVMSNFLLKQSFLGHAQIPGPSMG